MREIYISHQSGIKVPMSAISCAMIEMVIDESNTQSDYDIAMNGLINILSERGYLDMTQNSLMEVRCQYCDDFMYYKKGFSGVSHGICESCKGTKDVEHKTTKV